MNLTYLMPTRVLMGDNCLFKHKGFLASLGKKACIVTGTSSAKINGAYDDAVKALEANGQAHVLFDKVMANPTDLCVMEGGKLAREAGCDFVIGIGGGSPMDAAKAVAVLGRNDISKEEMYAISFTEALPLALVPTTAGTGSETTPYSVLVDTTEADGKTPKAGGPAKRSLGSPLIFPRFALLDANYMTALKRNITVNTAVDALSHAIEGMLTVRANCISDTLARESIAMIMGCMDDLLAFPGDPRAFPKVKRETLLLASAIAGMVIAQAGTVAPHSMGYHFTLNWGTDHGRANGLLMKSFLSWYKEREEALCKESSSYPARIPDLERALGMSFELFFTILERLLGKRETASEAEITAWSALPMKNALNTAIQPNQQEIERMYRESVG